MAAYHIPAAAHADIAALDVLSSILSTAPAGRLYKALVESKKAVSAGVDTIELHDPGLMLVEVIVGKDGSLADAEKIMHDVIDGVVKEPPSKEEVDRAPQSSAVTVAQELDVESTQIRIFEDVCEGVDVSCGRSKLAEFRVVVATCCDQQG